MPNPKPAFDQNVITRHLQDLEEVIRVLARHQNITLRELRGNVERRWIIEHGLLRAIQNCLDIGEHILLVLGFNKLERYADIFEALGNQKIISKPFAGSLKKMAGFRNLLVHEYTQIDLKKLHRILRTRLRDFSRFAKHVTEFLERQN